MTLVPAGVRGTAVLSGCRPKSSVGSGMAPVLPVDGATAPDVAVTREEAG
jgi:hypothetical protein